MAITSVWRPLEGENVLSMSGYMMLLVDIVDSCLNLTSHAPICVCVHLHSSPPVWYGEVLYFFKHDLNTDTSASFAVMAWSVPELTADGVAAVHPDTGFEIYLAPSMSGPLLLNQGDQPPCRVVPITYIKSIVHMFHDCQPDASGKAGFACVYDAGNSQVVRHELHNRRWLKPAIV